MATINFGAGPGKLPRKVLEKVQRELLSYDGLGISMLEMSHRSPEYEKLNNTIQQHLRKLMKIPENYKILFLQGGGRGLFAATALNLMGRTGSADYIVTGVEFNIIPEVGDVPLVADMSSNILTRTLDVSKFGIIFAVAQKNIGPAGVTVAIVREHLLGNPLPSCPLVLNFNTVARENSMQNNPPIFSIYVMGIVFEWSLSEGGVDEMEKRAIKKSTALYDLINKSNGFYSCNVEPACRSRMNVTFRLKKPELEAEFLSQAKKLGMIQLKGHSSVGGLRVSLYSAVTEEEVSKLLAFMEEFMNNN